MSRSRDLANLGDEATGGLVKADIGLGNVDNTSDADKPVSTAQQTALDAKLAVTTASSTYAPLASPAFTGTPTGITASHINSGTLGNTVQDNITRLGTVTTGTFNGTIGGDASMASSGLTVRNIEQVALSSDATLNNNTTLTTFFSPTYTNKFSGSKVVGILTYMGQFDGTTEGRHKLRIDFSGSNITNYNTRDGSTIGGYNYGNERILRYYYASIFGGLMTTDSIAVITADCKHQMQGSGSSAYAWTYFGNNTAEETFFTWIEYK